MILSIVILKVIVDEISMVKSDMLYQLDFRLQEIMQNQRPFGGISILVFGDLIYIILFIIKITMNKLKAIIKIIVKDLT